MASGFNRRPAAKGECISNAPFARPIPIFAATACASSTAAFAAAASPFAAAAALAALASFVAAAASFAFCMTPPPNISITFARSILPSLPIVASSSWMSSEPSSSDWTSGSVKRLPVGPWVRQWGPARDVHSYSASSPSLASITTERISFCLVGCSGRGWSARFSPPSVGVFRDLRLGVHSPFSACARGRRSGSRPGGGS